MATKQSLLDKAKSVKAIKSHERIYSEEEIELIWAWILDEISLTQFCKAMGKHTGAAYVYLALGCKEILRKK